MKCRGFVVTIILVARAEFEVKLTNETDLRDDE